MIVGHLIVGILIGTIAAAISLFFGSSVLWALGIYVAAGNLGLVLSAASGYVRSELLEINAVDTKPSHINSYFWLPGF